MQSEISLIAVLLLMLIADLILNESRYKARRNIACGLLIAHIILNLVPYTADAFGGMYHNTTMTSVVKTLLTMGTLLVFLQADSWLQRPDTRKKSGEFYVLTVSTLLGMYYMLTAANFLMFYVGLELASIPMACLVTLDKVRHHSAEAGAKFILSAMFSSALMLFGLSFIYGTCGTLYFDDLALQIAALVLSFAGLGFKLSLVPFHMWTPDTYQGAPTTVSGYLSVISKGAAAFSLMSILMKVFTPMVAQWTLMLLLCLLSPSPISSPSFRPTLNASWRTVVFLRQATSCWLYWAIRHRDLRHWFIT